MSNSGLAADMRSHGIAIVAWKLVPDSPWIRYGSSGVEQTGRPQPGQIASRFRVELVKMKSYVAEQKLTLVLTPADVDACIAGTAGIVLASEGADFLDGNIANLDAAYAAGLRHLQFVHYTQTPVGDLQSAEPQHKGLSDMGRQLVQACSAMGVLVDLAHSTGPSIDQALEVAKAPLIWSHGWVEGEGGNWQDRSGFLQRRLSLAHAKKIAANGGLVGVWGLGLQRPGRGWPVGRGDTRAYANELVKLVNRIGADHVALGTDIEGLGPDWTVNNYEQVRSVIGHLEAMKVEASVIERIAYGNYARVLKAVLKA